MEYKQENKRTYDSYAEKFDEKFSEHFINFVKPEADSFLQNLTGKQIIDLGSGPGTQASYFKQQGCEVLCVDFSEKMLELCKAKNLKIKLMDLEQWGLSENIADGIWAYASLLHVPKEKIPELVANMTKTLKSNGILAIAVKEGSGERFETNEKYPDTKRLFVYFTDEEIKNLFAKDLILIESSKTNVKGKYTFMNYLFRKK